MSRTNTLSRLSKKSRVGRALCLAAAWLMALAPLLPVTPVHAAEGDIVDNSGLIPFDQAFFAFEVEGVLGTLKEVPIWDEVEQMLDAPYTMDLDPSVFGNYQYWPSYRSTQDRRRSFIYRDGAGNPCAPPTDAAPNPGCVEVPLSRHVVHPLNYNHMTGEEMRLVNPTYAGGDWEVAGEAILVTDSNTDPNLGPLGVAVYEFLYDPIVVSPGVDRLEDDETMADFNSPIAPDAPVCVVTAESQPGIPEGSIICGGDPGEPGFRGFGTMSLGAVGRTGQYSTPALPLNPLVPAGMRGPSLNIPGSQLGTNFRLFDPAGCGERNEESPGSCSGAGYVNRLRKPTLRPKPWLNPDYMLNSEPELEERAMEAAAEEGEPFEEEEVPAFLLPSNENDYYRGANRAQKLAARQMAAALGKALFWDMQVGSDGVQACASCHFHAGVDDRTKNQLNPNHLGGDLTLQLHGGLPNRDLTVADFPFQRGGQDTSNNPGNPFGNVNDVASSMGVVFSPFTDIPRIGQFIPNSSFVKVVPPDIRTTPAADPIPLFQDLRRVEPRHTPTIFASAMNFDNFWDGRARHDFNGGSVFGATDPQGHVYVDDGGVLADTRQMIRFAGLASLATGPALSEFEMSFFGRNWAKIGKKLLQSAVTPLANQLVDVNDSLLGRFSNQGGSACAGLIAQYRSGSWAAVGTPGKPGLCISYIGLIKQSFYPNLWNNTAMHLEGCYAGAPGTPQATNTPQCSDLGVAVAIPVFDSGAVVEAAHDPFDGYVLTVAPGPAVRTDTNDFRQIDANMPLFFGLSVLAWVNNLIPDDAPMDRFYDDNPDAFASFGEANEPFLVPDLLTCGDLNPITGQPQGPPCITEVGNFKRDPGQIAWLNCTDEGCTTGTPAAASGTRQLGDPDPLLGMDFFLGSNLSLKNPNFRSLRCGECHAGSTLTDHTVEISHQLSFNDWAPEFNTGQPGVEVHPEPLGRSRVITGFALEGELQENAQDGIERNVADFCTVEPCQDLYGNPIPGGVAGGFPQGQALFDNGVYNIGVTPIGNDVSRGGTDAFGWPLALSYLAFKNLGGPAYTPGGDDPLTLWNQPPGGGYPLPNFEPDPNDMNDITGEEGDRTSGGLFEPSGQDQQINPGYAEEPLDPQLPPYLAKWASNIPVGDESAQDEVFVGLNTLCAEPILEGFVDTWGPFNPAAIVGETFNMARQLEMAMWPNVNRVNAQGSFKAPPLRNLALNNPYFHNGGKLTIRQLVDFYLKGGDFPVTNKAHRDFLIMNLIEEDEALGGLDPAFKEEVIVAVVDFLLELTDERVAFERAPFDHPEIFVPLDGRAPDNTFGRPGLLALTAGDCMADPGAGPCFGQVPAVGASGNAVALQNFLGVTNNRNADCVTEISHYCN